MDLYALAVRNEFAPGFDQLDTVQAISAETAATEWLYERRSATMSLVATGGGLLFGGDVNGRFQAFDDETGEVLWEINLGSAVSGFPITYAVDGRQYVAVSTDTAGSASGFTRLTPEITPSAGNNLFVFLRSDNPCDRMLRVLGAQNDIVTHRRALPHRGVGGAIETVRASGSAQPAVKRAFEFLVLTAARSGEVREAQWAEMDTTAHPWTIPATRMKALRDVTASSPSPPRQSMSRM